MAESSSESVSTASVPPRAGRAPVAPRATYRLQLGPDFGFDQAADLVPYLSELGVSHVYLSPVLQASPGSTHGYDVVDHRAVSKELGGDEAHARFCRRLGEAGLGQLVDIVPNHMAVVPENPWWWDVLENGPSSLYASFFDVEWEATELRLRNKVLLPVLGEHSGRVIESGDIRVVRDGGSFTCRYYEHAWPVAPRSLEGLLARAAARCGSTDLAFIADVVALLPPPTATDLASTTRRHRDKEVLRRQLTRLVVEQPEVALAIDGELALLNTDPDALDDFLGRQNFRLAFWRMAAQDLGYRRFFDINSLVGLRIEDESVFLQTHELLLSWLAAGVIDGVRIDHVDGLRDPAGYLQRLRSAAPWAWVVVEKILEPSEVLRNSWPVDGTTGYETMSVLTSLFVLPESEPQFDETYATFAGSEPNLVSVSKESKRLVLTDLLGSDLNRLTGVFLDVCERNRRFRDYSRHELHEVLREVLCCFPVYRSYVQADKGLVAREDEEAVLRAVADAKAQRPDLDAALFDLLAELLLLRTRGERESELVARFQQTSAPVMAKGVEDTAYYRYARFVALNEVGGDPARFGTTLEDFHAFFRAQAERFPRGLVATSTHDTKRSEDVRARLAVLSEIPGPWRAAVTRWSKTNERHKTDGMPDGNTEYFYYQTLIGAFPLEPERARSYILKSAREAKSHTAWTRIHSGYEEALASFVTATLADPEFTADLAAFVAPLVHHGRINSLAQTLLKLTLPGVPDVYQGSELWDLSLVDPDNRRPVDFERRRRLLAEISELDAQEVMRRIDEGLPKLWLIAHALRLRTARQAAFTGTYEPLAIGGSRGDHLVAFARGGEIVSVAQRFSLTRSGDWGDSHVVLPPGHYVDRLSERRISGGPCLAAELFRDFPVALLARDS